jgi:hypothetical protein
MGDGNRRIGNSKSTSIFDLDFIPAARLRIVGDDLNNWSPPGGSKPEISPSCVLGNLNDVKRGALTALAGCG